MWSRRWQTTGILAGGSVPRRGRGGRGGNVPRRSRGGRGGSVPRRSRGRRVLARALSGDGNHPCGRGGGHGPRRGRGGRVTGTRSVGRKKPAQWSRHWNAAGILAGGNVPRRGRGGRVLARAPSGDGNHPCGRGGGRLPLSYGRSRRQAAGILTAVKTFDANG